MLRTTIELRVAVDVINGSDVVSYQGGDLLARLNVPLVLVAPVMLQNEKTKMAIKMSH